MQVAAAILRVAKTPLPCILEILTMNAGTALIDMGVSDVKLFMNSAQFDRTNDARRELGVGEVRERVRNYIACAAWISQLRVFSGTSGIWCDRTNRARFGGHLQREIDAARDV